MSRQMRDGRLVEAGPGVDVDGVDRLICCAVTFRGRRLQDPVQAGWREKKTAVGSKGQSPEKGLQRLVGIGIDMAEHR